MPPSSTPPEDILRILAHGRILLAQAGLPSTARPMVWGLIVEAVTAIETTIGDQERRWLSSGTRSGGWSMIGLTTKEAREVEMARLMAGIKPGDSMRAQVQEVDYDRSLEVLSWLRFCRSEAIGRRLERSAYELAAGRDVRARALCPYEVGPEGRRIDIEIRARAVNAIRNGLRATHGIVIANDGAFTLDV